MDQATHHNEIKILVHACYVQHNHFLVLIYYWLVLYCNIKISQELGTAEMTHKLDSAYACVFSWIARILNFIHEI